MWGETIARSRGPSRAAARRLGGRLLTGRLAFLLAGVIDLALALWSLRRARRSGRSAEA